MFHSRDSPRLLVCDTGLYLEQNDIGFITVAICGGYISKYPGLDPHFIDIYTVHHKDCAFRAFFFLVRYQLVLLICFEIISLPYYSTRASEATRWLRCKWGYADEACNDRLGRRLELATFIVCESEYDNSDIKM